MSTIVEPVPTVPVVTTPPAPPPPMDDVIRGIWRENPVVVQMLGLCPLLAVSVNVENAIAMSAATIFVLVGSSFLVSLLKRVIPNEVRIASYILIIATFVTVADLVLEAVVPDIHKALGAFIALIVVNCIVLGRQEAFAARQTVKRSVLDAIGMGFGFALSLTAISSFREIFGNGTWLGFRVTPANFEPWGFFTLPPGGFFSLGLLLLVATIVNDRRARRAALRRL